MQQWCRLSFYQNQGVEQATELSSVVSFMSTFHVEFSLACPSHSITHSPPEILLSGDQQVKELTDSMQQLTAELDTQVNNGRAASEQLQKLKGEASVLQLWQQNVQAERVAEIEAVRAAKQVGSPTMQNYAEGIWGVCEG